MILFVILICYTLFGFVIPKGGETYDWLEYVPSCFNWDDATNVLAKHNVEDVHWEEKHQYTSYGMAWSKQKKRRLLDQRLKPWRLVFRF